ncbi:DNA repair protein RecO [Candidatus Saccharibacteria bacterium]|nr:DNA repair protein RecO [Candidatus Saccharibacteria bacterium]
MSKDIADIRTKAYVLRRTNYGEADRILNLITPEGKMSAIAKGVRKPKSKLAGGVEMFSLVEVNLHRGRGDLMTVTGARMLDYYGKIITNYELLEAATMVLKKINIAAEAVETPEYFTIVDAVLKGLNEGVDSGLAESWFLLNLLKASGEEVNLYRDERGEKLDASRRYNYLAQESAFAESERGEFGAEEIKLLRLMLTSNLAVVARVKNVEQYSPEVLRFSRIVSKMI